jgi:hypothetical protein
LPRGRVAVVVRARARSSGWLPHAARSCVARRRLRLRCQHRRSCRRRSYRARLQAYLAYLICVRTAARQLG